MGECKEIWRSRFRGNCYNEGWFLQRRERQQKAWVVQVKIVGFNRAGDEKVHNRRGVDRRLRKLTGSVLWSSIVAFAAFISKASELVRLVSTRVSARVVVLGY